MLDLATAHADHLRQLFDREFESFIRRLSNRGGRVRYRHSEGESPPRRGDVTFRGHSIVGRTPYAISQGGIAIVPQGRRIFKSLSVRENLMLPTSALARRSRIKAEVGRRHWTLEAVLAEFPQLAERLSHMGGSTERRPS